jgi:hypothetical protein
MVGGISLLTHAGARVVAAIALLVASRDRERRRLCEGHELRRFPSRHALWPWPLTPLTAQVLAAIWCLGSAGLGGLVDRRWSSARIPMQVAVLMLTLIAVAAGRAHADFAPANPLTWLWAAGMAGLLLAVGLLYVRMEHSWTPHRS